MLRNFPRCADYGTLPSGGKLGSHWVLPRHHQPRELAPWVAGVRRQTTPVGLTEPMRLTLRGIVVGSERERRLGNTLNVCLGHLPFPSTHEHHVDVMLGPRAIEGKSRLIVVEDSRYGKAGSALSEYAQLLWLYDNLDTVARGYRFVRIFHYRRFVSPTVPTVGSPAVNQPWSTVVSPGQLSHFDEAFSRVASKEIVNTSITLPNGILGQYASAHRLEDILRFTEFIHGRNIINAQQAAQFLRANQLIPACNIGVFKIRTFASIYEKLKAASEFLYSPLFIEREDYQRRSLGFLLERFQSYLLLAYIGRKGRSVISGHNMAIAEGSMVYNTIKI